MSEEQKMIRINQELLHYITHLHRQNPSGPISELVVQSAEKMIKQRTRAFSVFIIKSGIAKCYMTEDTGVDFIQEFFGEGEIFGEVEMFNEELTFCTIEAMTESVVYKIPKDHFNQLIDSDQKFNRLVLKLLATKIRYTAKRHSYIQSHPIETNLLKLIKELPRLTELIAKKDVANYMGITERSLNRTLNSLKTKGLLG